MAKELQMAKKSKRQIRKRSTRSSVRSEEFNPDYTAVKKDLKTIGSLAGFFVLVLIALSFFLR
jgi:hypothetical protein